MNQSKIKFAYIFGLFLMTTPLFAKAEVCTIKNLSDSLIKTEKFVATINEKVLLWNRERQVAYSKLSESNENISLEDVTSFLNQCANLKHTPSEVFESIKNVITELKNVKYSRDCLAYSEEGCAETHYDKTGIPIIVDGEWTLRHVINRALFVNFNPDDTATPALKNILTESFKRFEWDYVRDHIFENRAL